MYTTPLDDFIRENMWPFFTAFLWSNIFIIAAVVLQRKKPFKVYIQFLLFFFISVFSIVRLLVPIELPGSALIYSKNILPMAIDFVRIPLFSFGDFSITISIMLLFGWGAGIIIYWGKMILNNIRFQRYMLCGQEPADSKIYTLVNEIIAKTKIKTKIRVIQTSHVNTPMLTGFFKPVIYLPDIQFTDTELEYVLWHECNHYIYKDIWIKLLINIFCSLFWWNPLVYVLKRNMNHLIELKSDLSLTKQLSQESRTQYLEALLKVVKNLSKKNSIHKHTNVGISFVNSADRRKIKQRFQLINYDKPVGMLQKFANLSVCVLMLLIFSCSYLITVSSYRKYPPNYIEEGMFSIDEETAYLVDNKDGSFSFYVHGKYRCLVYDISMEPICTFPIYDTEQQ